MNKSRRELLQGAAAAAFGIVTANATNLAKRKISVIAAPSNLGLRPGPGGAVPGTWKMPAVLLGAGLAAALGGARVGAVPRIAYDERAQPDTRIRNGNGIRDFSLALAVKVRDCLRAGEFPVVLGGDCSVLLGSLAGARQAGGRGLIHIDGHSDFFHPGNYDTTQRLGSAAGMDLALATGRGEAVLTQWPNVDGPLVADEDAIQIGERDAEDPDYVTSGYGDILKTAITRITVQQTQRDGINSIVQRVAARLEERRLTRAWVHVDFDVLDESVLPAVDSPGTPGFTTSDLSGLLDLLARTGRVAGIDFAIYDPDLDPHRRYARMLVDCIAQGLSAIATKSR